MCRIVVRLPLHTHSLSILHLARAWTGRPGPCRNHSAFSPGLPSVPLLTDNTSHSGSEATVTQAPSRLGPVLVACAVAA